MQFMNVHFSRTNAFSRAELLRNYSAYLYLYYKISPISYVSFITLSVYITTIELQKRQLYQISLSQKIGNVYLHNVNMYISQYKL